MPPTFGNGKICYIEIPATDIARSSEFYERVFGWRVRRSKEGRTSFDDGVGEVSGIWVLDRPAARTKSLMVHIMVDNMDASLDLVVANGGEIVQPVGADAPEITAHILDPGGNLIGLYQHGGSRK